MKLITFHRLLIGFAAAFCFFFSTHQGLRFRDRHELGSLGMCLLSGIIGIAVLYYLIRLKRYVHLD